MTTLKYILFLIVLPLFSLNCKYIFTSYSTEPVIINNVGSKQTFTLKADPEDKHVWSIYLKITGELNGKAIIYTGYDTVKTFYKFEIPPGKVNMEKHTDWYDKECILTYQPIDCTSGSLKIEYEFGSD